MKINLWKFEVYYLYSCCDDGINPWEYKYSKRCDFAIKIHTNINEKLLHESPCSCEKPIVTKWCKQTQSVASMELEMLISRHYIFRSLLLYCSRQTDTIYRTSAPTVCTIMNAIQVHFKQINLMSTLSPSWKKSSF